MMKVAPPNCAPTGTAASERLVELLHGLLDEDAEGKRRLRGALGQALLKVATV